MNVLIAMVVLVCVQLKQMEVQLEEEYDEKQKVLKEKRELESKLLSAQDKVTNYTVSCCNWNKVLDRTCEKTPWCDLQP